MDIRNVDLNLLLSLDALIAEKSVSRAAARQGVSQPAMSASLARLRDLFHDQLLVRSSHGMVPTPRALELAVPIRNVLDQIGTVLEVPKEFEPTGSRRTFRLQGTDYVEAVVLPLLIRKVACLAPGVKFLYRPPDPLHLAYDLEHGHLDMGIGYIPDPSPRLRAQLVFRDRFVCIARRGHPEIEGSISLTQFAELGHIQVLPRDSEMYATPLDAALSKLNIVRHIEVWEPSFLNIVHLVSVSDLVTTVPERLTRLFDQMFPIQVVPPPVDLPAIEVRMFWAERMMLDAGHMWLRKVVMELGRSL